jgi:hypothetical protein
VDHGMFPVTRGRQDSQAPEYLETMRKWLAAHVGPAR